MGWGGGGVFTGFSLLTLSAHALEDYKYVCSYMYVCS